MLKKQSSCRWVETPWRPCYVTVTMKWTPWQLNINRCSMVLIFSKSFPFGLLKPSICSFRVVSRYQIFKGKSPQYFRKGRLCPLKRGHSIQMLYKILSNMRGSAPTFSKIWKASCYFLGNPPIPRSRYNHVLCFHVYSVENAYEGYRLVGRWSPYWYRVRFQHVMS